MRRIVLLSGTIMIVSWLLSTAQAQNESSPVGVVTENQATPSNNSQLTADYPMNRAGVLIQGVEWTIVANQLPAKTKIGRGLAASLSYGIVPAKIVAEYIGEHAPIQVGSTQPILCLCHFASLPGDPVLVKLHPKKGSRELDGGRMIVYPVVGGSRMADANKSDLIAANVSHPEPQVWLIRPQFQLEPGEYALMLGTQNMAIFPFTIAVPSAHPSGAN